MGTKSKRNYICGKVNKIILNTNGLEQLRKIRRKLAFNIVDCGICLKARRSCQYNCTRHHYWLQLSSLKMPITLFGCLCQFDLAFRHTTSRTFTWYDLQSPSFINSFYLSVFPLSLSPFHVLIFLLFFLVNRPFIFPFHC